MLLNDLGQKIKDIFSAYTDFSNKDVAKKTLVNYPQYLNFISNPKELTKKTVQFQEVEPETFTPYDFIQPNSNLANVMQSSQKLGEQVQEKVGKPLSEVFGTPESRTKMVSQASKILNLPEAILGAIASGQIKPEPGENLNQYLARIPYLGDVVAKTLKEKNLVNNPYALNTISLAIGLTIPNLPGGEWAKTAKIAPDILTALSAKYAPDIVEQIVAKGSKKLAEKAIKEGGEEAIRRAGIKVGGVPEIPPVSKVVEELPVINTKVIPEVSKIIKEVPVKNFKKNQIKIILTGLGLGGLAIVGMTASDILNKQPQTKLEKAIRNKIKEGDFTKNTLDAIQLIQDEGIQQELKDLFNESAIEYGKAEIKKNQINSETKRKNVKSKIENLIYD